MVIRSKDEALSAAQQQARTARAVVKSAENIRSRFAHKRWDELTPPEKEQLLRALAVHFGFIAPD
jgi:hypothetical protein